MAQPASTMERSSVLDSGTISSILIRDKDSQPVWVSDRGGSGAVSGTGDVRHRSSNSNTGSVSTSSTERRKQGNTKPIEQDESSSANPQKPTNPPKPKEPSKPETEDQSSVPVYLLRVNTPVADIAAVPLEKDQPIVKVEVGEKDDNGNKTEVDTDQQHEDKTENIDESQVDHDS